MCFYDRFRYSCADWKWGNLRRHCQREYRTGETCGTKLIFETVQLAGKCKACEKLEKKKLRHEKSQASYARRCTSSDNQQRVYTAAGDLKILEGEIAGLSLERDSRQAPFIGTTSCAIASVGGSGRDFGLDATFGDMQARVDQTQSPAMRARRNDYSDARAFSSTRPNDRYVFHDSAETSFCMPEIHSSYRPRGLGEAWCNSRPESVSTQELGRVDTFRAGNPTDVPLSKSLDETKVGITNAFPIQGVPVTAPNVEGNQKGASPGSTSSPAISGTSSLDHGNGNEARKELSRADPETHQDTQATDKSSGKRRSSSVHNSSYDGDRTSASQRKAKRASTIPIGIFPCIYHAGDPNRWNTDRCRKKHGMMSELRRHLESHQFYYCRRCLAELSNKKQRDEHCQSGCQNAGLSGWDLWQKLFEIVWPSTEGQPFKRTVDDRSVADQTQKQSHQHDQSINVDQDDSEAQKQRNSVPDGLLHSSLPRLAASIQSSSDSLRSSNNAASSLREKSSMSSLSVEDASPTLIQALLRRLENMERDLKASRDNESRSSDRDLRVTLRQVWRALVQSGSPEALPGSACSDLMGMYAPEVLQSVLSTGMQEWTQPGQTPGHEQDNTRTDPDELYVDPNLLCFDE